MGGLTRRLWALGLVVAVAVLTAGLSAGATSGGWVPVSASPRPSYYSTFYTCVCVTHMAYHPLSARVLVDVVDTINSKIDTYAWGGNGAWQLAESEPILSPNSTLFLAQSLVGQALPGIACWGPMVYDGVTDTVERIGNGCVERWIGQAWTPAPTVGSEPLGPADYPGLAFDPLHNHVVMERGNVLAFFDGLQWTTVFVTGPSPLDVVYNRLLTYDPITQSMLLVGETQSGVTETWRLDGQVWTQLNPATSPTLVNGGALVTPGSSGPVLVEDGASWRWDGTNWNADTGTQLAGSPSAAWDPNLHASVALTTATYSSNPTHSQTWEHPGP